MARNDLIISLVRSAVAGDQKMVRSTVDEMVADEKAKKHSLLADRLQDALEAPTAMRMMTAPVSPPQAGKEFLLEKIPQRTLSSLILPRQTRAIVENLIEEQQRADLLRSNGLQPRHRLLFSGPPGNGKTSLAEAVADALTVPFFSVRYDMLIGSYLGETTQRLRRLFEYARVTPCVLLFDEFDVVGKERGDPHETGEIKRVVSTLLLQVDALPSYVVVIAATNHGELLDRAVWRRFEVRIELPQPTRNELTIFFDNALKRVGERSGVTGAIIAKKLGDISYAEASDFWLDVSRRTVLSLGSASFKNILQQQLDFWSKRVGAPVYGNRSKPTAIASVGRSRSKKNIQRS